MSIYLEYSGLLDVTVHSENYKMIYENTLLNREKQNIDQPLNQMSQVKVDIGGSHEGCDDSVPEVRVDSGQVPEGAIVTSSSYLTFIPQGCDDPEEVRVAAGEVLEGALITHTESDGKYPFNACQAWKIITDSNQVSSK